MRKFDSLLLIGVLLFEVLLITFGAVSQQAQEASNKNQFSDLTITLMANKPDFLLLEPIGLTLTLRNETPNPIKGHIQMKFRYNFVDLVVTNEAGQVKKVGQLSTLRSKTTAPRMFLIQPQQQFQVSDVFYNLHELFPEPGRYTLQAVLYDSSHQNTVTSAPITLETTQPKGLDAKAYSYIKSSTRNEFVLSGGEKPEFYNELSMKFPGTVYSDYSDYIVARRYVFFKEYERAEPLLRRLRESKSFALNQEAQQSFSHIEKLKLEPENRKQF